MTTLLGTVTTADPLAVTVDGATTAVGAQVLDRGDAYAPAAGERVLLLARGRRLYVLGKV